MLGIKGNKAGAVGAMNISEEWKSMPDGFACSRLTAEFLTKAKRFPDTIYHTLFSSFPIHPSLFMPSSFFKSSVTTIFFQAGPS